jgi:hypothetical protein
VGPVHLIATGGTVGSFALTTSDLQDLVAESTWLADRGHDDPRPIVVTGAQRSPSTIHGGSCSATCPSDTDRPSPGQDRREGARRR